jgi:hypothetical protein
MMVMVVMVTVRMMPGTQTNHNPVMVMMVVVMVPHLNRDLGDLGGWLLGSASVLGLQQRHGIGNGIKKIPIACCRREICLLRRRRLGGRYRRQGSRCSQ